MNNDQHTFTPFVQPYQYNPAQQPYFPSPASMINYGYCNPAIQQPTIIPVPVVSTDDGPGSMPAQINMGGLVEPYTPTHSIGLPMHSLVEPSTMAPKDGPVSTTTPVFNNLVGIDPNYQPQQMFAIQPIPEDVDRSMLPRPVPVNSVVEDATAHLSKAQAQDYSVGRKVNNWFTRILDQRGDDYITSGKLSVDEVSKNAEKILDDMIAGRVDYIKQGPILISPIIIDTLINYCANKLAINRAIQYALGYVYNDYTSRQQLMNDPERLASLSVIDDSMSRNITQAIAIVNQDIGVYDILYKKLTFVEATKNASSLFSLTNDLNAYKKQVKKRY